MMELFPRSHRALQSQMPSFSADLLEDFKIDLAKLKNIHDIYYNVASKSQRPKGKPKAQNDGKKAEMTGEKRGPITMAEICNIGEEREVVVGKNMELFRWVQKGKRKEAKWVPAVILAFDGSNGRHSVRWTTPEGRNEREWDAPGG